jgi:hypothetical protein
LFAFLLSLPSQFFFLPLTTFQIYPFPSFSEDVPAMERKEIIEGIKVQRREMLKDFFDPGQPGEG